MSEDNICEISKKREAPEGVAEEEGESSILAAKVPKKRVSEDNSWTQSVEASLQRANVIDV